MNSSGICENIHTSKWAKPLVKYTRSAGDSNSSDEAQSLSNSSVEKKKKSISCQCCNKSCIKTSKCVRFASNLQWHQSETDLTRQKIQLKVSTAEVEESIVLAQHQTLMNQHDRINNVLTAVQHFVECLRLESKACRHLCREINSLVVNDQKIAMTESLSSLLKKLCDSNSNLDVTLTASISNSLEPSEHFGHLKAEFENKQKDFLLASQNFKLLLDNAELSLKQLDNLQRQHESILLEYQHSRCMLDQYIPEMITEKMKTLYTNFPTLIEVLKSSASERVDLASLFNNLQIKDYQKANELIPVRGLFSAEPSNGSASNASSGKIAKCKCSCPAHS